MYNRVRNSNDLQENKPTALSLWVMILNIVAFISFIYILFIYPLYHSMPQTNNFSGVQCTSTELSNEPPMCSGSEDVKISR